MAAAGDMWVAGVNCWSTTGHSIGTPGMNACLNRPLSDDVGITTALALPTTSVHNLRAKVITG